MQCATCATPRPNPCCFHRGHRLAVERAAQSAIDRRGEEGARWAGGRLVPDLSSALETVTRRTLPPRGNEGAARCSEDGPRRNGRVVIWAIVEQASRGAKPASLSAEALCALQQLLCRCCGRGAASFTTGVLPLGNADLIQGLTSAIFRPQLTLQVGRQLRDAGSRALCLKVLQR
jgi:hypothetical protein